MFTSEARSLAQPSHLPADDALCNLSIKSNKGSCAFSDQAGSATNDLLLGMKGSPSAFPFGQWPGEV
jgi:hypothetical protein